MPFGDGIECVYNYPCNMRIYPGVPSTYDHHVPMRPYVRRKGGGRIHITMTTSSNDVCSEQISERRFIIEMRATRDQKLYIVYNDVCVGNTASRENSV